MELFGFTFEKKKKTIDDESVSFVAPSDQDGTSVVQSTYGTGAGYYGQFVDIDGTSISSEKELILKYRAAATNPECEAAISDIVNASIISDDDSAPVSLVMADLEMDKSIKTKIGDEFERVVKILNFSEFGHDYFRRWYIDGRLYFHVIPDENQKNGIKEVREIEPTKIKKVREITTDIDRVTGVKTVKTSKEYFQFNDSGLGDSSLLMQTVMIQPDSIVYIPSGLLDDTRKTVVSYLHQSLKLVNNLRMMEDSLVIYRISRAPERRIFYIDVGNLPKGKAEEYVQSIMSKYRNKLVYDAATGDIRDDRKSMSMLEDFWLPRKEGGRGTEISTLPGGDNLGQIEDVNYFREALYRSLNVPISRLSSETGFNVGRSTEISRDEVKFQKFISRLRKKFSYLLINLLRTQLLLKGIITEDDWATIKENITVDFAEDNFFSELKDFEILRERLQTLEQIKDHIGTYWSNAWVRSNILRQSDQDVERLNDEIAKEKAAGEIEDADADVDAEDEDV
jgi:hypothetical protein